VCSSSPWLYRANALIIVGVQTEMHVCCWLCLCLHLFICLNVHWLDYSLMCGWILVRFLLRTCMLQTLQRLIKVFGMIFVCICRSPQKRTFIFCFSFHAILSALSLSNLSYTLIIGLTFIQFVWFVQLQYITRNTLDCEQSNVYSSRTVFSAISQGLFRSSSI